MIKDRRSLLSRLYGLSIGSLLLCAFMIVMSILSISDARQESTPYFQNHKFTELDGIAVAKLDGTDIYHWNADSELSIASVSKLLTARLAIRRWGLNHRFRTDFFVLDQNLYVKGYGDPFLVSEEIEQLAMRLNSELENRGISGIKALHLDDSFFEITSVPGRSRVSDPYNAPLSALSANFNTAKLKRVNGRLQSAEAQTPLTATAKSVAKNSGARIDAKSQRINLQNRHNSLHNFAELLAEKMGLKSVEVKIDTLIPKQATLLYQHFNSNSLDTILRGTLEYSNNFIANQLFLAVAAQDDQGSVSFDQAQQKNSAVLTELFEWKDPRFAEGAGLSRNNRFSARQIEQLLFEFKDYKSLLKQYSIRPASQASMSVLAHAKTGTLSDVHSFAGYLDIQGEGYVFVFIFNRPMPYRYRHKLLQQLVDQLVMAKDSDRLRYIDAR